MLLLTMKRIFRRLPAILTIITILAMLRPALAQDIKQNPYWRQSTTSQVQQVEDGPENEVTAPRYTYFQTNTTFSAIGAGILDPTGQNTQAAVPMLGQAIALLTKHQPVRTQEYLAYMAGKAGLVEPAYAQGQDRGGFDLLKPVQPIWIAARNIAYLVTSLILIVVGFMIMLRKKIDPQTVVGIQQALPKLIVTLLLVTFSYAIAGLVIDMIYFLTFFGIKLLALNNVFSDGGTGALAQIQNKGLFRIGLANIFRIGGPGNTGPAETSADAIGNLVNWLFASQIAGTGAWTIANLVAQPVAFVIFAVAILYALFRLFFTLLMAYIQIIFLSILGPLQLMLNALPGSEAFSKWFRNLLANAMAFPAASLMIVFAAALMGQTGTPWYINQDIGFTDSTTGVGWVPPLVGGIDSNAPGVDPVDAVQALLGFGVLLMTPKVVEMVKEALQAPEFKYGSAIGEAVGFGWNASQQGVSRSWGATRGYSEQLAAQEDAAITDFVKLQGRAPTAAELAAIRVRLAPMYRLRGPQGQLRGRLGKLLGK